MSATKDVLVYVKEEDRLTGVLVDVKEDRLTGVPFHVKKEHCLYTHTQRVSRSLSRSTSRVCSSSRKQEHRLYTHRRRYHLCCSSTELSHTLGLPQVP